MRNKAEAERWFRLIQKNRIDVFSSPIWSVTAMVIIAGLSVWLAVQVRFNEFWLDEAGQYWLSQGQHHFLDFGTENGSLSWEYLHQYNLDPPGFSGLLFLWTEIFPVTPQTLRLLPLMGTVGGLVAMVYFSFRFFSLPLVFGVALALSAALATPLRNLATELRPYSFEFLAVIVTALALANYSRKPSSKVSATFIVLLPAIFLFTTRYSYVIAAISAAVALTFMAWRLRTRQAVTNAALSTIVAMIGVVFIWVTRASVVASDDSVSYVSNFVLRDLGVSHAMMRAIFVNIVAGPQISFLGLAVIFLVGLVVRQRSHDKRSGFLVTWANSLAKDDTFQAVATFIFTYLLGAISLSALGIYPWYLSQKWSIGYVAVTYIAAIMMVSILLSILKANDATSREIAEVPTSRARHRLLRVGVTGLVPALVGYSLLFYSTQPTREDDLLIAGTGTAETVAQLREQAKTESAHWVIDHWLWPSVRMSAQLGGLEDELNTTDGFVSTGEFNLSDNVVSEFVAKEYVCRDSTSFIVILRGTNDEWNMTLSALEILAETTDCEFIIFPSDLTTLAIIQPTNSLANGH